jgi:hypothetical protein
MSVLDSSCTTLRIMSFKDWLVVCWQSRYNTKTQQQGRRRKLTAFVALACFFSVFLNPSNPVYTCLHSLFLLNKSQLFGASSASRPRHLPRSFTQEGRVLLSVLLIQGRWHALCCMPSLTRLGLCRIRMSATLRTAYQELKLNLNPPPVPQASSQFATPPRAPS